MSQIIVLDEVFPLDMLEAIAGEFPDDEYATLAGLLLAQHEELPEVGESFEIGAHRFEVREMSDRRIEPVRITRA